MRYKDGDRAVVRSDLIEWNKKYYNDDGVEWNNVVAGMMELAGKEVTIRVFADYRQYFVDEDVCGCCWTDDMFEKMPSVEVDVLNYI